MTVDQHPAVRYFRVLPDHRLSRGQAPLTSPFEPTGVPDSGLLVARCRDRRGHPVPDLDCGCGLTSTESWEALAIYTLAMEPMLTEAYDQVGELRPDESWLDQMAWCEVTAIGPHLGADEVEFDQSRALQLTGVHLPACRGQDEGRIADYYGVPVSLSDTDRLNWLEALVPGFDRSGCYCVTCGYRSMGRGLCGLHWRANRQFLRQGMFGSGIPFMPALP